MDEERYDQLYNRILDGENWDYSTLDELLAIAESNGKEMGLKEASLKIARDIKYENISTIIEALSWGRTLLSSKIEELDEKGFSSIANGYREHLKDVEKGFESLRKIRKALYLADDFSYNMVFQKV